MWLGCGLGSKDFSVLSMSLVEARFFLVVVSFLISLQVLLFSGTAVFVLSIPVSEKTSRLSSVRVLLVFVFFVFVRCCCFYILHFCVWFCFIFC